MGPNGQPLCPGNTITLTAGNAGATYAWSNTTTNQTLLVTAAGTYTVTVTNANGCSKSDDITINQGVVPVVSLGADRAICAGNVVNLNAGNPGAFFIWSTNVTTQAINVTPAATTTYTVTVTNTDGCTASDNVVVTVNPLPVVNLGLDTTICTSQIPFTLNAGGNFSSYFWSTGDPTQTTQVSAAGTYIVTVVDSNGCEDQDDIKVTVVVCPATHEQQLLGELKMYPNPTQGLVNLEMTQFESGNYRVNVLNIDGRQILTQPIVVGGGNAMVQLNLATAPKGMYLVKLQSEKGIMVRRLVIQ